MKKRISYFVCGGHGSTVCLKAWTPDYITNLFLGVVDNGGNTGLMGRIYRKLNKKYIPLGDLRNIWGEMHKDSQIGEFIQLRISHAENSNKFLTKKLIDLRDLLDLKNEISGQKIREFVNEYIDGYSRLNDSEKRDLKYQNGEFIPGELIKHNIGNLFLTGVIHIFSEINQRDGYLELNEILHELNIFPEYINIYLVYNQALDLEITSRDNKPVLSGEDQIDLIDFAINPDNYKLSKNGKRVNPRMSEIVELLTSSDLIVIPPGSESNIYPWVQIYKDVLKEKIIIKIVNLTDTRVSMGIVEEIIFLESLGLTIIYLYPKTFSELRTEIGDDSYSELLTKYLVQGKKPNDLSINSIILKLKILSKFSDQQIKDIKQRILSIVKVNIYTSTNDSIDELKAYREDDPFVAKKGFRHDINQIGDFIHKAAEVSEFSKYKIIDILS